MRIALLIICLIVLVGCTNSKGTIDLLISEGFNDIEITGYDLFACSQDDWFHTGFIAIKDSEVRAGTVCEGFLKGKTIRFK